MDQSDRQPFEALRSGRRDCCARFVEHEYDGLFRWLCRLTRSPDEAADLTQESFAAFWASLRREAPQVWPQVSPRTWLYSIGRNQWRKHCRSRGAEARGTADGLEEVADPRRVPWANLEQREFAVALKSALADLTPEFREVFSLRVWHEFSYDEIAAILGISADLARWRFFRARQQAREKLSAWEDVEEKR